MNGVDGFAQNQSIVLDLLNGSADAKAGSSNGPSTEGAGAFADVLSTLSNSGNSPNDPTSQSSQSPTVAARLMRQTYLLQQAGAENGAGGEAQTGETAAEPSLDAAPSAAAAISNMLGASKAGAAQALAGAAIRSLASSGESKLASGGGAPGAVSDSEEVLQGNGPDGAASALGEGGSADAASPSPASTPTKFTVSTQAGAIRAGSASSNAAQYLSGAARASAVASFASLAAPARSVSALNSDAAKGSASARNTSAAASSKEVASQNNAPAGPSSSPSSAPPVAAAIVGALASAQGTSGAWPLSGVVRKASASAAAGQDSSVAASSTSASAAASFARGASVQSVGASTTNSMRPLRLQTAAKDTTSASASSDGLFAASAGSVPFVQPAASGAVPALSGAAQASDAASQVVFPIQRQPVGQAGGLGANQGLDLSRVGTQPASATSETVNPDPAAPQLNMSSDWGSDVSGAGSIKVSVLDQQTHFPPVVNPSPAQQIAEFMAGEVSRASNGSNETAAAAQSNAAAGVAGSQTATSSVKILDLQLEPESLGRVTIQMRLSGTRLELQVQAASAETMRMIAADKDLLVGKLSASGYSVDALVVKVGEAQVAPGQSGLGAGGQSTSQTHSPANPQTTSPGASQNGEPSANDRSSTQRDRAQPQGRTVENAPDVGASRLAGGDLYV